MGSDVSLSKAVRANLLSLQNTAGMMDKTQNRLATGNKVNSALDNPSNFFTAAALNSRAADMSNLLDSMASGIKTIEAASNGITALTKNLESMQSTLRQARQDKSFQTKSFDVTDTSVLALNGGQFGVDGVNISLADATEAGVKSQVTTAGTSPYLGASGTNASATGAGARTVITTNGTINQGEKFTVAGVEVTAGADVTAAGLATTIQSALDLSTNPPTTGKYTVSAGAVGSANEGKVIIETVDTAAAPATVAFANADQDVKGTTTFNYSAVSSAITVGGQAVSTGATFEDFVASLQSKAEAGKYTVSFDATTKDITLTNVDSGANAPAITGITTATPAKGATSEVTLTAGVSTAGETLKIDGETLTLAANATADALGADIKAKVEANATLNAKYSVTYDAATDKIKFTERSLGEGKSAATFDWTGVATDPTSVAVAFNQGVNNGGVASPTAAKSEVTLTGAANAGAGENIIIDGQTLSLANNGSVDAMGADIVAKFGANTTLTAKYNIAYDAATDKLTITSKTAGSGGLQPDMDFTGLSTDPTSDNVTFTAGSDAGGAKRATSSVVLTGADSAAGEELVIDGETITLALNAGPDALAADIKAKVAANATLSAKYDVSYDSDSEKIVFTEKSVGAGKTATSFDWSDLNNDPTVTTVGFAQGVTATPPDGQAMSVLGKPGAFTKSVAAEKDEFTVSYDGKTANISISAVKGGIGSTANALETKNWQDATVVAVNNQLVNQGITGVEAKFDENNKLTFVAKTAEAKTLAVSGTDSTALFGTNGVNTGKAEKSELNATKTVDKFVELINRDHAGKVRASNDNGKLRIENLSTQDLDVGIDTGGAMSTLKVEGNTVRANLSKQFNELRDQLDKLGDDASFNGINLLRGDKLKITFNESGTSSIDIQAKDANGNVRGINASNLGVDSLIAEDLDTDADIDGFLAKLSSALTELRSQASAFGSNLSSVENRQSFTKNMINTLETGAANLTLADTNEEAANLLALQTRQQLSSSALSMASQQDQAVLQLLR
jgi:flagellin